LAMEVLAADEPRSLKNYWRALAASAMKSCLGAPQELAAVSLNLVEYQPITNHAYNGNRKPVSIFPDRPSCKL